MSEDRTLERTDPDWRLYVADFPADTWSPNGWVSARLHVQPTARVKVEQQRSPQQGPLVWVAFGPHAQVFIPRAVALKLRDRLNAVLDDTTFVDPFSVDVPVGVPTSVAAASHNTATAPTELSSEV